MPTKEQLIKKLTSTASSRNFTKNDLDSLLSKCGCIKLSAGRGSGVKYLEPESNRILVFDLPHPGKELYRYQIKMLIAYLKSIGEL